MTIHGSERVNDVRFDHGAQTKRDTCHDCCQGILVSDMDGFGYWDEEGDGRGYHRMVQRVWPWLDRSQLKSIVT